MIIAFSRTTAAVETRRKSVTRREWSDAYHDRMVRALNKAIAAGEKGLRVQAWSAGPHRGGKRIGTVLLTSITREFTHEIPDSDWEAEGFAYMEENGIDVGKDMSCAKLWRCWRIHPDKVTSVIRFEILDLVCERTA